MQISASPPTGLATPATSPVPLESLAVKNPPAYPKAIVIFGTPDGPARAVFKAHTMRSITPKQIDQMRHELQQAGYRNEALMGVLKEHGATFEAGAKAPNTPIDLVQTLYDEARAVKARGEWNAPQLEMARSVEFVENVLNGIFRNSPYLMAPGGSEQTQSLVTMQMQEG